MANKPKPELESGDNELKKRLELELKLKRPIFSEIPTKELTTYCAIWPRFLVIDRRGTVMFVDKEDIVNMKKSDQYQASIQEENLFYIPTLSFSQVSEYFLLLNRDGPNLRKDLLKGLIFATADSFISDAFLSYLDFLKSNKDGLLKDRKDLLADLKNTRDNVVYFTAKQCLTEILNYNNYEDMVRQVETNSNVPDFGIGHMDGTILKSEKFENIFIFLKTCEEVRTDIEEYLSNSKFNLEKKYGSNIEKWPDNYTTIYQDCVLDNMCRHGPVKTTTGDLLKFLGI